MRQSLVEGCDGILEAVQNRLQNSLGEAKHGRGGGGEEGVGGYRKPLTIKI